MGTYRRYTASELGRYRPAPLPWDRLACRLGSAGATGSKKIPKVAQGYGGLRIGT
jgi:hypothetical protein